MICWRPLVAAAMLAAILGFTTAVPAGAATAPAATTCAARAAPPPAVDTSEVPAPGLAVPPPPPIPATPVGGPRLGECGEVLAPGAPPIPAGENSASWVLADLDSGAVLAARDPHARQRPASLLKVLTALVAIRKLNLDTVVNGTAEDANQVGSRVGVGPGGQYTVKQLLTGLLLNSGNDAAHALAVQLGGVGATLAEMTTTARAIGALDTQPATPSGLDGPGMSTSAYDLAAIFRVAMREPAFATAVGTRLADFPGNSGKPGFQISNDNRLLAGYPGAIGGKTGFTDDARHTFIGAAARGGRRLVVVLMRGEQVPVPMWMQGARLLDYGFALPAGTQSVGTLVDTRPAEPTSSPPTTSGPDAGRAAGAAGGAGAAGAGDTEPNAVLFGLAGLAVGATGLVATVRIRRHRARRS